MKKRLPEKDRESPIGVFDSGIGGLTVVREMRRLLPEEDILYFGDTARLPYGSKSPELIKRYALEDASFLYERGVKIIVVACHSASSWALAEIKSSFPVPVVGVVEPGAKAALRATKKGKIGVIGTRATISSGSYERALKEKNKRVEIVAQPTPLFVPLVEEGFLNHQATRLICQEYLKVFFPEGIDTLLLGCTHYPLLKPLMEKLLPKKVKIIDASFETASEVERILRENNLRKKRGKGFLKIYLSDITPEFEKVAERFLGERPSAIFRDTLREYQR
jgi:glutamate racemase